MPTECDSTPQTSDQNLRSMHRYVLAKLRTTMDGFLEDKLEGVFVIGTTRPAETSIRAARRRESDD